MDGEQNRDFVYVYATAPIDFWAGWWRLEHLELRDVQEMDQHKHDYSSPYKPYLPEFISLCSELAEAAGWEGDGEWLLAPLPDPDRVCQQFMACVKQRNNGTCFFISPFPLVWLEGWGRVMKIDATSEEIVILEDRWT